MKTVIIGAGWSAREAHLPGFKAEGQPVAAICDVNEAPARGLADRFGIPKIYSDWREMIAQEKPDAVSVCLPNVLHREPTLFALEHGAHVLCEKPLATSVAEAKEMFAAADKAGKVLMAAQSWRFDATSRAIQRVVAAGEMGEIYYGEANAQRRLGIPGWGVFHQKQFSHGGALLDIGVHMLDLAVWLMGNPEPVRVSAQTQAKFGTKPEIARIFRNAWDPAKFDVEDFAVALVHFANGATLLLRTSWAAHIEAETFQVRVVGTDAGATTIPPVIFRNRDGIPSDEKLEIRRGSPYEREISHWIKVVKGEAEPIVKPEETLNVQRIIEAAYRSAETGAEAVIAE